MDEIRVGRCMPNSSKVGMSWAAPPGSVLMSMEFVFSCLESL